MRRSGTGDPEPCRTLIDSDLPPAGSGFRVATWDGGACANVTVAAARVSRELVAGWAALARDGLEPEIEFLETTTGLDGSFDFPDMENAVYFLRAEVPGCCAARGILDASKGKPLNFELRADRARSISGKVVDCSGKPVQDVEFLCRQAFYVPLDQLPLGDACEFFLFASRTISDAKGRILFPGLPAVLDHIVSAEPDGFIPLSRRVPCHEIHTQRLVLKKPCILEGRVVDSRGKPVRNAEVYFREPQSSSVRVFPDFEESEEGRFRFDAAPEGSLHLQAIHRDHGHVLRKIRVSARKPNYHELVLPDGVGLRIRVTDTEGNRLEGIRVVVRDLDTGAFIEFTHTDSSGAAEIHGLNRGDLNIVWITDEKGDYSYHEGIHSFQENSEIRVELKRRVKASLTVLDEATREPLSRFMICLCSYRTPTVQGERSRILNMQEFECRKGHLEFAVGQGENFEFVVLADGYVPGRAIAMAPGPDTREVPPLEIVLRRGETMGGRVVDAIHGNPVPGATVRLYLGGRLDGKPAFALSRARSAITDDAGHFYLAGLPEGRFFLKVQAPGFAPAAVDSLELDPRGPAVDNVVRLWPGGLLSGVIIGESGTGLEGGRIEARLPGTNDIAFTSSNPDGTYFLSGIPPGPCEVSVWDPMEWKSNGGSRRKLHRRINMPPGGAVEADFSLNGSCSIHGLCTCEGKMGFGMTLCLEDEDGKKTCTVSTTDAGYYRINAVPPGKYTLQTFSTRAGTGGSDRRTVELSAGGTRTIDIDISGRAVHGSVRGPDGNPLHAAEVELLNLAFEISHTTVTDQNGDYTIMGVDEGDYSVAARGAGTAEERKGEWHLGGGGAAVKVDFDLKPGGAARVAVSSPGGEPLAGATVLLSDDFSRGVQRHGITGLSGVCVFDGLGLEPRTIVAGSAGLAPGGGKIVVPAGERMDTQIVLAPGGVLRVIATGSDGAAVPGARVTITGPELFGLDAYRLAELGFLIPSDTLFRTGSHGRFTLAPLPQGPLSIRIEKNGATGSAKAFTSAGEECQVRVTLD